MNISYSTFNLQEEQQLTRDKTVKQEKQQLKSIALHTAHCTQFILYTVQTVHCTHCIELTSKSLIQLKLEMSNL